MSERPWFAHYEPTVPQTIDVPAIPLPQLLRNSARNYPDNLAIRMVLKYLPLGFVIQSKLSYRQLDELTDRFAAALQQLGIKPGDRVSIMLPNIPQQVIAYFGIAKAGAIVVNTNPTYTPRELQHQLADSGATAIIMLSGLYERLAQIRDRTAIEHVIIADVPDTLKWPFNSLVAKQVRASGLMKDLAPAAHLHQFEALLKKAPRKPEDVTLGVDNVVLFQYSGGTTGTPKAAMLTNRNLVANTMQMRAWFTTVEDGNERILGALPFFHVYGMTVTMLFAVAIGGEMVLVPDPRNTNHILDVLQNQKISLYPGVPGMYIGVINHPKVKEYDLHSIKACLSGGAALPVEVAEQFKAITGGNLVEGYGMTELSPVATANPINGESRAGSIGLPLPNTDVRVVSLVPDENNEYTPLAIGEEGEIVVKGPQVMKGYWNREEETASTIDKDGWLHTGDIAKQDEDGYFYIVDRKKDLIIASGYNIVPREVEEVLFMHPKVQEAAVAGVPDPKRGETVKAYIILKEGERCEPEEIRNFCKENLAPYKVPTLVEFRTELPKTQIGKVLRRVLVEEEKQKQNSPKAAETV
ncbi:MAG TPA: long-chain fatty acid--CoA ligase [Caldilineaceae bacterium]|nr:long-chain fatty acid--CoA ligase [Caldilineaceae bacterium]